MDREPIELKDGRIFLYDGLDIILFDPRTDTFRKSLTTPTYDGNPTTNKKSVLLPDGNVLIARIKGGVTFELRREILKTLHLTHVRDFDKDIFPYIKAYPELYKEYLRQREIAETYSYFFIYNPVTERIEFTKSKMGVNGSSFMLLIKNNNKVYTFYSDYFLQGKLVNEYKNYPIIVYDIETKSKDTVYADFNGCGQRHAILKNAVALSNGNILLQFNKNICYVYDPKTNKISGPHYLSVESIYFLKLEDGRILVTSDSCPNLSIYSNWTRYPEKFIKPLSDNTLKRELDLIDKDNFYTCKDIAQKQIFHGGFLHRSMLLNDGRLIVWGYDDIFKHAKIYTPKSRK